MRSKDLTTPHQQMPLIRAATPAEVDDSLIARQPSLSAAISLCVMASGLEEKEIYLPLGIDAGHWTRIKQGAAHFPVDKLDDLMTLCGNEAPLRWMNTKRGYKAIPVEDAKDRTIREQSEQIARLNAEIETLAKYGVIKRV